MHVLNTSLGIGAACAVALAEAGASICLVQRQPPPGREPNLQTYNSIRALSAGANAKIVECDLSDLDAVKQLFQKALDVMGGQIHILVNCAGIQRRSPSVDFSEGDWDDVCIHPIPLYLYAHPIWVSRALAVIANYNFTVFIRSSM